MSISISLFSFQRPFYNLFSVTHLFGVFTAARSKFITSCSFGQPVVFTTAEPFMLPGLSCLAFQPTGSSWHRSLYFPALYCRQEVSLSLPVPLVNW